MNFVYEKLCPFLLAAVSCSEFPDLAHEDTEMLIAGDGSTDALVVLVPLITMDSSITVLVIEMREEI